jgi:predicted DNA-binding transcriptional regulator AlpA
MFEHIRQLPDPATPTELATVLRITAQAVRRAIRRGELRACHTSHRGGERISHADMESWLAGGRVHTRASASDKATPCEPVTPTDPWTLLDTGEVGALVNATRVTLWRWTHSGKFPTPDKVHPGGRKMWFRSTVQRWCQGERVRSDGEREFPCRVADGTR